MKFTNFLFCLLFIVLIWEAASQTNYVVTRNGGTITLNEIKNSQLVVLQQLNFGASLNTIVESVYAFNNDSVNPKFYFGCFAADLVTYQLGVANLNTGATTTLTLTPATWLTNIGFLSNGQLVGVAPDTNGHKFVSISTSGTITTIT